MNSCPGERKRNKREIHPVTPSNGVAQLCSQYQGWENQSSHRSWVCTLWPQYQHDRTQAHDRFRGSILRDLEVGVGKWQATRVEEQRQPNRVMEAKKQVRTWKIVLSHETWLHSTPNVYPNIYVMVKHTLHRTINAVKNMKNRKEIWK